MPANAGSGQRQALRKMGGGNRAFGQQQLNDVVPGAGAGLTRDVGSCGRGSGHCQRPGVRN